MKSSKPKVAFEILGKPLVRYVVDAARGAGCDDVVTVLGHGREAVEPLVSDTLVAIQHERLGTGHAVMMAREQLESCNAADGNIIVLSGDSPLITSETVRSLVERRESTGAAAVILTLELDDPFGYGRIIRDGNGQVTGIVEQKDCTPEQALVHECNSSIYCFDGRKLLESLDRLGNDNAQHEYYLTDVIAIFVGDGLEVAGYVAPDNDEALGINNRLQLSQATKIMQRRINERHMLAGVTMIDPGMVWIGPEVQIAQDVEIWPLSIIMGTSTVGEGSRIGPNTRITDSVVGRDCTVDESVVVESVLEDGVSCGPRAYLRPGVHMLEGSKAGTHVELKKSTIGRGSKVPHLSYIGDTVMGDGVNVGAGSITCNYDGASKHPTTIGDRAFIGSDTMMIAPVNIGNDTVIAAGSAITKDVPDGALGVARSKQKNLEGYTKHVRGARKPDED